jgi:hypothetical protein
LIASIYEHKRRPKPLRSVTRTSLISRSVCRTLFLKRPSGRRKTTVRRTHRASPPLKPVTKIERSVRGLLGEPARLELRLKIWQKRGMMMGYTPGTVLRLEWASLKAVPLSQSPQRPQCVHLRPQRAPRLSQRTFHRPRRRRGCRRQDRRGKGQPQTSILRVGRQASYALRDTRNNRTRYVIATINYLE